MKRLGTILLAAVAFAGMASPAAAQLAVVDVRAIAQALETARNTMNQLQEAQRLYQSLNSISNVRGVASVLDNPMLRSALPQGMHSTADLISGDLRDLGAIGQRAESIMSQGNLSLEGVNQALGDAQGAVRKAATISARNQAYGEQMLQATQTTGDGLANLSEGLASSTTQRQSIDIGARATIENAGINNRILQMMAQQQAERSAAALKGAEDFAASQRRTNAAIANGTLWPTWNGQQQ